VFAAAVAIPADGPAADVATGAAFAPSIARVLAAIGVGVAANVTSDEGTQPPLPVFPVSRSAMPEIAANTAAYSGGAPVVLNRTMNPLQIARNRRAALRAHAPAPSGYCWTSFPTRVRFKEARALELLLYRSTSKPFRAGFLVLSIPQISLKSDPYMVVVVP
jgi:hypothetical protein